MPIYTPQPPIDVANVASKMPSSLQYPTGLALTLLQRAAGGNDPSSVMTTVGPNAIPLGDEEGYLRKVAGSAIDDLGSHFLTSKGWPKLSPQVERITDAASQDPSLIHKIGASTEAAANGNPNLAQQLMQHWAENDTSGPNATNGAVDRLIQSLADAYHKGF